MTATERKIIEIDQDLCDGCGQCVPSCAEGAIEVVDGKAQLVAEKYCDGLGACLGECPTGALKITEREAEEFDEHAVEQYLLEKAKSQQPQTAPEAPCCPSSQIQTFVPAGSPKGEGSAAARAGSSSLTHWPVQIRLVPPEAPFLKGADLLVAADCTAFASGDFHRNFLEGKVVMVGCPKFDDVQAYIDKFTEIFRRSGIRSITSVVMEVPCCSGLPVIVRRALENSGKQIPHSEIVLSTGGEVLQKPQKAVY